MAVIREKRQFQVGTIGVARASEGGRIVGQAISQAADQFADAFYREGLQFAEKAGTEAGQTAERERIMTINPQTGQPEAYTPPAPFGRVAAEAYQRVVERRFQQSMDDEMRAKSAEIATRYEDNPNSAALYETAMSDYIASMAENAEGQFKGYITDTGTSYLNLTRSNLAINQIRRERAAAREAQAAAAAAANNQLQALVSQYGPDILSGPTVANALIESSNATVDDGVTSGLFTAGASSQNSRSQALSAAYGLIQYAANNTEDPDDLRLLQHAIGTQNPALVPAGFEYVADALRGFGSDFQALADIEKFSDGLLSDRIQYANVIREREIAEINRQEALSIFDMEQGTAGSVATATSFGVDPIISSGAVAQRALDFYSNETAQARAATAAGRNDLASSITSNRNAVFDGYVQGLHLRAVQNLTPEQTNQLEASIMAQNPNLAPTAESRQAVSALLQLSRNTDYNIVEDFPPFIGSYRDSAGRFVVAQNEATAFTEFKALEPTILDIRLLRGGDIDAAIAAASEAVTGIDSLADTVRSSAITEIQFRGGQAYVSQFFEGSPSETQIASAGAFLEGSDITTGLTQGQVDLLARARTLGVDSGRESNLRTHFNTVGNAVGQLRRQDEARLREFQDANRIFRLGAGDPTSVGDRRIVDERIQSSFAPQLQAAGYQSLGEMFADPAALQNPDMRQILETVNSMNVLPESLQNAFVSLANGSFVGSSPATLISHYTNFRDYSYGGVVMDNPMMRGLTEAQRATLDFLADAAPIIGSSNTAFADLYTARSRLLSDTHFEDRAKTFFGSTPYEFVRNLDGANNLSASALRGMEAAAVSLYALSAERGLDVSAVKQRLERQIDRTYPDGGGIVFAPDMSSRTRAPLSYAAPGNEDVMEDYVIRRLSQAGVTSARLGITDIGSARTMSLSQLQDELRRSRSDGVLPNEGRQFFLQTIGVSTSGYVQYQVMERVSIEQGTRRPMMETTQQEMDGDVVTVTAPMIISNQDPLYLLMLGNKTNAQNEDYISRAESVGRVREMYEPAPEFEFGINP
jgi:hypothetical protein